MASIYSDDSADAAMRSLFEQQIQEATTRRYSQALGHTATVVSTPTRDDMAWHQWDTSVSFRSTDGKTITVDEIIEIKKEFQNLKKENRDLKRRVEELELLQQI